MIIGCCSANPLKRYISNAIRASVNSKRLDQAADPKGALDEPADANTGQGAPGEILPIFAAPPALDNLIGMMQLEFGFSKAPRLILKWVSA